VVDPGSAGMHPSSAENARLRSKGINVSFAAESLILAQEILHKINMLAL